MCGIAEIRNLITHAGHKRESAAVTQLRLELPLDDEKNVAAIAPMIGNITR